ncbi:MAG: hypothetical protein F6K24_32305, partial [Okeania sp. SIO2D1]|nr:hypothetical protein [Okeania sp. SIO2D1]
IDNYSEKSYKIIYRNSNNSRFCIRNYIPRISLARSGGTEIIKVNSPVIGNTELDIFTYAQVSVNDSMSLVNPSTNVTIFSSPCSRDPNDRIITAQEAVKIVESLKYLNP